MGQKGKSERIQTWEGFGMSSLFLRCRDPNAQIRERPPGCNSSPSLTASEEMGTSVLQPQGSGFHEQLEWAQSKFFLEPPENPIDCHLDFALVTHGAERNQLSQLRLLTYRAVTQQICVFYKPLNFGVCYGSNKKQKNETKN